MASSKEYMRVYMLRRYHERRQMAYDFLGNKCAKCSSNADLQLDRIDRASKSFEIARLWSCRILKYWEEVKKCQLLCQSCHQKKTLVDLGQQSAKETHGTLSSYRYCRCAECRGAMAAYMREYHQSRK